MQRLQLAPEGLGGRANLRLGVVVRRHGNLIGEITYEVERHGPKKTRHAAKPINKTIFWTGTLDVTSASFRSTSRFIC